MPRIGLLAAILLAGVPSAAPAQLARVSVSSAGGQADGPSETPELSSDGRVTLRVGAGRPDPFGVLVESLGAEPAPLVVEGSYYWNAGGRVWAAGGNVLATPLP